MISDFEGISIEGEENAHLSYVVEYVSNHFHTPELDIDDNQIFIPDLFPAIVFKKRLDDLLKNKFDYKKYLKDKELQELIKVYNLDSEKFWYLFLFVYDYSFGLCNNAPIVLDSPLDQMDLFIDSIIDNTKELDNNEQPVVKRKATISIKLEGKHSIVIEDQTAIFYLAYLAYKGKEGLTNPLLGFSKIIGEEKNEVESIHKFVFAKTFLEFLEKTPQKRSSESGVTYSKLFLISKLIYFSGMTDNDSYDIDDNALKSIMKLYKNYKIKSINKDYSEFF